MCHCAPVLSIHIQLRKHVGSGSAFVQDVHRGCALPENDSGCAPTACLSAESSDIYSRSTPPSNFEIGSSYSPACRGCASGLDAALAIFATFRAVALAHTHTCDRLRHRPSLLLGHFAAGATHAVPDARSGFPWASLLHVARGATTVAPTQLSRRRQEIALLAQGNAAAPPIRRRSESCIGHTPLKGAALPPSNRRRACRLPHWSQRNASIAIAVSIGRVTMNRCPSSIICSRAFGMSRARMRPLTGGTRGSSRPISTRVGCRSDQSQGRLVHPVIARSWNR